jgi:hypothetical protein
MDNVVPQLHLALAEALAARGRDLEAEPVTVAEIYQEFLPYRLVRARVGFDMNADYEHALLRLLSGEDGLVRLEPAEAREHLAHELTAPNPDVTLFRRYAACDVWVTRPADLPRAAPPPQAGGEPREGLEWRTPDWLADGAPASSRQEEIDLSGPWLDEPVRPAAGLAPAPAAEAPRAPPAPPVAPEPLPAAPVSPPAPSAVAAPPAGHVPPAREPDEEPVAEASPAGSAHCAFCEGVLPAERVVRYCPHCGIDQNLQPCVRCGEALEPGWRYCVGCGAPAPDVVSP